MTADDGSVNRIFDIEESIVGPDTPLHSAKIRHLYEWWRAAGAGGLPLRQTFDILDHKAVIANLFLTEVTPAGDFVFRLLGEEVIEILGRNPTGETVRRSAGAEHGHHLYSYYQSIVESATCRRCIGSLELADGNLRRFESVDCPLSNDGARVDMIIGVMDILK